MRWQGHSGGSNIIWSTEQIYQALNKMLPFASIVITDEALLIARQYGASLINRDAAHYKRHGLMPGERTSCRVPIQSTPGSFNRHDVYHGVMSSHEIIKSSISCNAWVYVVDLDPTREIVEWMCTWLRRGFMQC